MRNDVIRRIRETLTSGKAVIELYEDLSRDNFPAVEYTGEAYEFLKHYKKIDKKFFSEELDHIEKNSESPIEEWFCKAVLLIGKSKYYNLLHFTETPASPISEYQESLRSRLKDVESLTNLVKDKGWKLDDFLNDLIESGKLEKIGYDAQEFAQEVHSYVFIYKILDFEHSFHLTMQPHLSSVKVNGRSIRPDIFVWLPSDESLRLVVECDGYRYHSNRKSFNTDRQRDRVLTSKGYNVIRFSGIEIYNDPFSVAQELVEYLEKMRPSPPFFTPAH